MSAAKKNTVLFQAIALLQGMVFYASIAALYREAAGITLQQITQIESISYLLTVIFEVPWGFLAEKIGYKKSMVLCSFLYFLSKIVFWRASSYGWFLAERILLSIVYAGLSGVDTTMLYLSDPENSQKNFGIHRACGTAGMLVSSLIYSLWIRENYRMAGFLTMIPYGIAAVLTLFLTEVQESDPQKRMDLPMVRQILKAALSSRQLLFLVLSAGLFSEAIHLLTVFFNQPKYISVGISLSQIGFLYILINILGLSAVWSERFTKKLGVRLSGTVILTASIVLALIMAYSMHALSVVFAVILMSILFELFMPLSDSLQQDFVMIKERAAALSINAVLMELVCALTDLVIGHVADISLSAAIASCAGCFALSLVFFLISTSGLASRK
ncbi:MAG: MFS transporter [Solobacterium sp.]|nr:MFS transporter [Solobacterium sp.]